MTVTVDLVSSRALNLLKELERFNIIRLISPVTGEDADRAIASGETCPLCAVYRHEPNAETIAAIEEGRAMMRGEIPANRFHSAEEMWAALDADDGDT